MVITPRISEKSYGLSRQNIYVFDVPMSANKAEVVRELTKEYPDIEIADVRLLIAGRRGNYPGRTGAELYCPQLCRQPANHQPPDFYPPH